MSDIKWKFGQFSLDIRFLYLWYPWYRYTRCTDFQQGVTRWYLLSVEYGIKIDIYSNISFYNVILSKSIWNTSLNIESSNVNLLESN